MNTHIERIRKLVALQHVDDDIHAIEQELRKAPEEVEELARRFAEQEELRNRILDKLQHLREQQKRIEQDIEGESSRIKKSKSKLMQVENDREYQAVVREMDNMERQSRGREEDRMAIANIRLWYAKWIIWSARAGAAKRIAWPSRISGCGTRNG